MTHRPASPIAKSGYYFAVPILPLRYDAVAEANLSSSIINVGSLIGRCLRRDATFQPIQFFGERKLGRFHAFVAVSGGNVLGLGASSAQLRAFSRYSSDFVVNPATPA